MRPDQGEPERVTFDEITTFTREQFDIVLAHAKSNPQAFVWGREVRSECLKFKERSRCACQNCALSAFVSCSLGNIANSDSPCCLARAGHGDRRSAWSSRSEGRAQRQQGTR
jgi:hypothetical protein